VRKKLTARDSTTVTTQRMWRVVMANTSTMAGHHVIMMVGGWLTIQTVKEKAYT